MARAEDDGNLVRARMRVQPPASCLHYRPRLAAGMPPGKHVRSQAPYPRPPAELANLPPRQAIYNGAATPQQLLWQAANSLLHTGRHTLYLGHDGDLFVEDCTGTRTWSRMWPGEEKPAWWKRVLGGRFERACALLCKPVVNTQAPRSPTQ